MQKSSVVSCSKNKDNEYSPYNFNRQYSNLFVVETRKRVDRQDEPKRLFSFFLHISLKPTFLNDLREHTHVHVHVHELNVYNNILL